MTENERMSISGLLDVLNTGIAFSTCHMEYAIQGNVLEDLIRCIEELEQYRAIGTVEELEAMKKGTLSAMELLDIWCVLEDLKKYSAIGTIEEFKALKEKNEAKKVVYREQNYGTPWLCPECEASQIRVDFMHSDGSEPKEKHSYCWKCGTKIDWQ